MLKCAAKVHRVDPRRKNQLVILTEVEETRDLRVKKAAPVVAAAAATPAAVKVEGEEGATPAAVDGEEAAAAPVDGAANTTVPTENGDANESVTEGGAADAQEVDTADAILDYVEGVTEIGADVEANIPVYNASRPVAASMISKLECYECKLCNRYFDSEKTAEVHTRTVSHHRQFGKFLTEKSNESKIAAKRAAANIENEKRKQARLEKEAKTEETVTDAVTTPAAEGTDAAVVTNGGEAAAAEETAEALDDGEQPAKKQKVEMYDPLEATTDAAEDVEMVPVVVKVEEPAAPTPVPTPATPVAPPAPIIAPINTPVVAAAATTTPKPAAAVATPATPTPAATPSPAATPKSANSNSGTPGRGGRGGNRGNGRGRGRGRRF